MKINKTSPTPWLIWVRNNTKALAVLVVVTAILAALFLFFIYPITVEANMFLIGAMLVSALYVTKIPGLSLRSVPHLKIHLIAASWSVVLIIFPLIAEGYDQNLLWIFLAHYFYVLGIAIPFDIRDLKYDDNRTRTIPQVIGVGPARIIALFSLVIFSVIMFSIFDSLWANLLFYIAVLAQMALVIMVKETSSDVYCAGAIDGAVALLGLAYFL